MAAGPCARTVQPYVAVKKLTATFSFSAPFVRCRSNVPTASFSTSQRQCVRDNNRNRGLSALRSTGLRPRQTLSVKKKDFERQQLPTPVKIKIKPRGTENHGLWDFFKDRKLLQTPSQEKQHGRSWTIGELRTRDWDALHQLWWTCVKERNRLATEKTERHRLRAGYGDYEANNRDMTIQKTMKAILETLAERQVAYREAFELAKNDPDIDLSRTDGPQYTQPPYDMFEEEELPYNAQSETKKDEPLIEQPGEQIEEKLKHKAHSA